MDKIIDMKNIIDLLEQVALISKRQDEDATGDMFNIFRVCGVNYYEKPHSAILAEFLNPKGSHGLKSKFLDAFLRITLPDFSFETENASVHIEYSMADGRIDILIEDASKKQGIVVENKLYAADQPEQLKRYNNFANERYKDNYRILYLTLWGKNATEQSGGGVDYKSISYQKEITAWLEQCVEIAEENLPVREILKQYINHLKSIMNINMNPKIIELFSEKGDEVKDIVVYANQMNNFVYRKLQNIHKLLCNEMNVHGSCYQTKDTYLSLIEFAFDEQTFCCETGVCPFQYRFWTCFYPTNNSVFTDDVFANAGYQFDATERDEDIVSKIVDEIKKVLDKIENPKKISL